MADSQKADQAKSAEVLVSTDDVDDLFSVTSLATSSAISPLEVMSVVSGEVWGYTEKTESHKDKSGVDSLDGKTEDLFGIGGGIDNDLSGLTPNEASSEMNLIGLNGHDTSQTDNPPTIDWMDTKVKSTSSSSCEMNDDIGDLLMSRDAFGEMAQPIQTETSHNANDASGDDVTALIDVESTSNEASAKLVVKDLDDIEETLNVKDSGDDFAGATKSDSSPAGMDNTSMTDWLDNRMKSTPDSASGEINDTSEVLLTGRDAFGDLTRPTQTDTSPESGDVIGLGDDDVALVDVDDALRAVKEYYENVETPSPPLVDSDESSSSETTTTDSSAEINYVVKETAEDAAAKESVTTTVMDDLLTQFTASPSQPISSDTTDGTSDLQVAMDTNDVQVAVDTGEFSKECHPVESDLRVSSSDEEKGSDDDPANEPASVSSTEDEPALVDRIRKEDFGAGYDAALVSSTENDPLLIASIGIESDSTAGIKMEPALVSSTGNELAPVASIEIDPALVSSTEKNPASLAGIDIDPVLAASMENEPASCAGFEINPAFVSSTETEPAPISSTEDLISEAMAQPMMCEMTSRSPNDDATKDDFKRSPSPESPTKMLIDTDDEAGDAGDGGVMEAAVAEAAAESIVCDNNDNVEDLLIISDSHEDLKSTPADRDQGSQLPNLTDSDSSPVDEPPTLGGEGAEESIFAQIESITMETPPEPTLCSINPMEDSMLADLSGDVEVEPPGIDAEPQSPSSDGGDSGVAADVDLIGLTLTQPIVSDLGLAAVPSDKVAPPAPSLCNIDDMEDLIGGPVGPTSTDKDTIITDHDLLGLSTSNVDATLVSSTEAETGGDLFGMNTQDLEQQLQLDITAGAAATESEQSNSPFEMVDRPVEGEVSGAGVGETAAAAAVTDLWAELDNAAVTRAQAIPPTPESEAQALGLLSVDLATTAESPVTPNNSPTLGNVMTENVKPTIRMSTEMLIPPEGSVDSPSPKKGGSEIPDTSSPEITLSKTEFSYDAKDIQKAESPSSGDKDDAVDVTSQAEVQSRVEVVKGTTEPVTYSPKSGRKIYLAKTTPTTTSSATSPRPLEAHEVSPDAALPFAILFAGHVFMALFSFFRWVGVWDETGFILVPILLLTIGCAIDNYRLYVGVLKGEAGLCTSISTASFMLHFSLLPLVWIAIFELFSTMTGWWLPAVFARIASVAFCVHGFNEFMSELTGDFIVTNAGNVWRHTLKEMQVPFGLVLQPILAGCGGVMISLVSWWVMGDHLSFCIQMLALCGQALAARDEVVGPYLSNTLEILYLADLLYIHLLTV